MKLAVLGGSFNPVHNGHLFLAETVLSSLQYDRAVMIPACHSPFKQQMETAAKDRLEMLAVAVAGDSRFAIDDCEIRREGVSYTIDTLQDIIARYGLSTKQWESRPALVIGDDLAAEFPKWRDSRKILEIADLVIARRTGSGKVKYPFPFTLIDNEKMDISSQMIRRKIADGEEWHSLVPAAVKDIIEEKRLYGLDSSSSPVCQPSQTDGKIRGGSRKNTKQLILQIETSARENLSLERFLHSRNTAIFAFDLCRRLGSNYNLDPDLGYLAGIAHDLGKQLDHKSLLKLAKSDGMGISALEEDKPGLLHGRAAAVLLKERFCIHNKDVLEAVAVHTSGSANMGPLAKVVYIADKVEVSRNIDPAQRVLCYEEEDLDRMLYSVLNRIVSKLQSRELDLCEDTMRLLEKMKGKRR